jgi:hypothetical protein
MSYVVSFKINLCLKVMEKYKNSQAKLLFSKMNRFILALGLVICMKNLILILFNMLVLFDFGCINIFFF